MVIKRALDADGRVRAVLALGDPGVPNWLDTGGYSSGTVMGRRFAADSAGPDWRVRDARSLRIISSRARAADGR